MWLTLLVSGLLVARFARADPAAVPLGLQAVLLRKVLAFDRTVATHPGVKVVVVYDSEPVEEVEEALHAFRQAGLSPVAVTLAQLEPALANAVLVFQLDSVDDPAAARFASSHKILSAAERPERALAGAVALGVRRKPDGRPELLIHLTKARAEGQDLSSDLLSLAHVLN